MNVKETRCPKTEVERYINDLPEGSAEKVYYRSLFDVLCSLRLPKTEAYGFACIVVFHQTAITLHDGRIVGGYKGVMGTIEDISGAVAVVFAAVNPRGELWKADYPWKNDAPEVMKAAADVFSQIQKLPIVKKIDVINLRSLSTKLPRAKGS